MAANENTIVKELLQRLGSSVSISLVQKECKMEVTEKDLGQTTQSKAKKFRQRTAKNVNQFVFPETADGIRKPVTEMSNVSSPGKQNLGSSSVSADNNISCHQPTKKCKEECGVSHSQGCITEEPNINEQMELGVIDNTSQDNNVETERKDDDVSVGISSVDSDNVLSDSGQFGNKEQTAIEPAGQENETGKEIQLLGSPNDKEFSPTNATGNNHYNLRKNRKRNFCEESSCDLSDIEDKVKESQKSLQPSKIFEKCHMLVNIIINSDIGEARQLLAKLSSNCRNAQSPKCHVGIYKNGIQNPFCSHVAAEHLQAVKCEFFTGSQKSNVLPALISSSSPSHPLLHHLSEISPQIQKLERSASAPHISRCRGRPSGTGNNKLSKFSGNVYQLHHGSVPLKTMVPSTTTPYKNVTIRQPLVSLKRNAIQMFNLSCGNNSKFPSPNMVTRMSLPPPKVKTTAAQRMTHVTNSDNSSVALQTNGSFVHRPRAFSPALQANLHLNAPIMVDQMVASRPLSISSPDAQTYARQLNPTIEAAVIRPHFLEGCGMMSTESFPKQCLKRGPMQASVSKEKHML